MSLILVRATVNLPGMHQGTEALVDPEVPTIRSYLEVSYLMPVTEDLNTLAGIPPPVTPQDVRTPTEDAQDD